MKFILTASQIDTVLSHLTRGAWIEIQCCLKWQREGTGRTSHEVRGLKFAGIGGFHSGFGRTSHEVRGLKLYISAVNADIKHVAPHTRCVD